MKRFTYFILLTSSVILNSCLREDKVDLAKPDTFTRFYSDGYNDVAVSIDQTKDGGFIVLGNMQYKNNDTDKPNHNILVMKTDAFGSVIWKEYYPSQFDDKSNEKGYIGNSLIFNPDSSGYIVVGQQFTVDNSSGRDSSALLVMEINDTDGSVKKYHIYDQPDFPDSTGFISYPNINLNGKAAVLKDNGHVFVAASDIHDKSVALMELDYSDPNFKVSWSRNYSQGEITLSNKMFYKGGKIFVGGNRVQQTGFSSQFIIRTQPDAPSTEAAFDINTPVSDEFTSDFSLFPGGNFGFTGYKDERGGDIIYYVVNSDGAVVSISKSGQFDLEIFNNPPPNTQNTQFEAGNSIINTRDGGLIILGTITSYAGGLLGRGDTDLILMKLNGFSEKEWSITYGSKDADNGNCIRQTRDGGYIVLGTTRLGGLRTIMLIKTDKKGEVN